MLKKITPNIIVADVNKTIRFYCENLGFEFVMGVKENKEVEMNDYNNSMLSWALIKKDGVEVMLQNEKSILEELPGLENAGIDGGFTLYIDVKDLVNFYEEVKNKVDIVKDIHKTFYGADEFIIRDINGHIIYFAESQNK